MTAPISSVIKPAEPSATTTVANTTVVDEQTFIELTKRIQGSDDELVILKQNFLNEIEFHRKHCEGESCNVMIYLLFRLAKRTGIEFSKEEDYVI